MLNQYRGLKREIYVLFYGRVVTSMGAVIWPMMRSEEHTSELQSHGTDD